ncbi:hypothetical protein [Dysgonomonas termitidis]|uniref:Uncharacterized protein n=1 Tax=Dysgonomonas termitidis TaxID=1516126 RepID=A0ABV9L1R6_9BACT
MFKLNKELKKGDTLYIDALADGIHEFLVESVSINKNCISVKIERRNDYYGSPFLFGHKNGKTLSSDSEIFYVNIGHAKDAVYERVTSRIWMDYIRSKKEINRINEIIEQESSI